MCGLLSVGGWRRRVSILQGLPEQCQLRGQRGVHRTGGGLDSTPEPRHRRVRLEAKRLPVGEQRRQLGVVIRGVFGIKRVDAHRDIRPGPGRSRFDQRGGDEFGHGLRVQIQLTIEHAFGDCRGQVDQLRLGLSTDLGARVGEQRNETGHFAARRSAGGE